ncbi:RBBP8 [Lepeophtheirus salmonis]|uniref:RBBP8 n=1 Tax=Lepeophtheirus salmonis TaxID=72036 RepID=A0A7R8H8S8_LEPSM|nr:RBBP8 [Lepeophtheirus salmonis]CAF2928188.1 RBBP8 [Lepeophtheirus salmonis]
MSLIYPMHSKKIPDEVTESKPFSNIIQQHSTQLKKTKVQHSYDISESKPFSNIIQQRSTELKTTKVLNLNEINESHRFSNVMQPFPSSTIDRYKKEPFSPLKFNNSRLISSASSQSRRSRGSSVLELNPKTSIHVPETPDLIEEREKIPIVKDVIPETEYPDFIEEEDVDVPKSRPLSPIISKKKHMSLENVFVDCYADFQDDLNTSSPSILSRKKVSVKENKWGILPDKDSDLSISKKERLKQGKIQSFLRTPKQNERYLCSPIKSNVHPPPDEDDYPLTSTQVSTDQDFDDIDDGPVRKRSARALLEGFNCEECKAYYKDTNLSEEQVKKLLKACSRHRAKVPPPSFESQNERWELEIRDDENDERNITQMGPPLKLRKKTERSFEVKVIGD